MRSRLLTITVLFLLHGIFALNAVAQGGTCSLQVDVFAYTGNEVIEGSSMILTNLSVAGNIHTGLRRGRFEDLVSGKYNLQVKKAGYDSRVREFEIDCSLAGADGVVTRSVFLGDPVQALPDLESKDGRVLNGMALHIPKPVYPKAMGRSGIRRQVTVRVVIDEDGNVISGRAVDENSLFGEAAVRAALGAKFRPTRLDGQLVKVVGDIIYNFVP